MQKFTSNYLTYTRVIISFLYEVIYQYPLGDISSGNSWDFTLKGAVFTSGAMLFLL